MSEITSKYKLNLGDKTLYLTHTSGIKTRRDYNNKMILGNHYVIEDDIPNQDLPCTMVYASDFTQQYGEDDRGHNMTYTKTTQWLIDIIKQTGEKI
tara:strand:- start:898 stop:1185 length:288 start_codon:yes stop_codon:yes gene_type:complete